MAEAQVGNSHHANIPQLLLVVPPANTSLTEASHMALPNCQGSEVHSCPGHWMRGAGGKSSLRLISSTMSLLLSGLNSCWFQ